jgi:hypothetical protein
METFKGIVAILCLVLLYIGLPAFLIIEHIKYKRERDRLIKKIKDRGPIVVKIVKIEENGSPKK